jgi:hypothetical protein
MRRGVVALALLLAATVLLVASAAAAPPEIKIKAPDQVEATEPAGAHVSYEVEVSVEEGEEPPAVVCTPESGSLFPMGGTTITCTAGPDSASKTVTVADTTQPAVTAPSGVSDSTTDPGGKTVDFTVSATDLGQPVSVSCTPAPGSNFPIGTTAVQCTADPPTGPSATVGFNVVLTLDDQVAPTLTVPADITTEATGASTAVSWTASATDNVDPSPAINCSPASGSGFPVGPTAVSCTATDGSGNSSSPQSFTVTVNDTTDPTLSLPSNQNVETENPAGTTVTYSAGASDLVAGSIAPSCSPASGASFPIGTTSVNCTASDGANSTAGSFTVTVALVDHTPPLLTGLANRRVEANGPAGNPVTFPIPTAVDALDGPIPGVACSKASGSTFPVGDTLVTCSATDAHGNTGSGSFTVTVGDSTPPALYVPADWSVPASTQTGIPATNSALGTFLASAVALDIVDPRPTIQHDAPAFFSVGLTVVTFEARDAVGNKSEKRVRVTVLPLGSPPVAVPPAPSPPADVRSLKATPGDRRVTLSWTRPAGINRVSVTRAAGEGVPEVVYTGAALRHIDRGLINGTEYRYVVRSLDAGGNSSAGVAVTAVPRRNLLRSPKDGARLRKPPRLVWAADAEADYYNVQLRRNGIKILSAWPVRPALPLRVRWRFEGRAFSLGRGLYEWHVWPGYGARVNVDYGPLLGTRTFRIVR